MNFTKPSPLYKPLLVFSVIAYWFLHIISLQEIVTEGHNLGIFFVFNGYEWFRQPIDVYFFVSLFFSSVCTILVFSNVSRALKLLIGFTLFKLFSSIYQDATFILNGTFELTFYKFFHYFDFLGKIEGYLLFGFMDDIDVYRLIVAVFVLLTYIILLVAISTKKYRVAEKTRTIRPLIQATKFSGSVAIAIVLGSLLFKVTLDEKLVTIFLYTFVALMFLKDDSNYFKSLPMYATGALLIALLIQARGNYTILITIFLSLIACVGAYYFHKVSQEVKSNAGAEDWTLSRNPFKALIQHRVINKEFKKATIIFKKDYAIAMAAGTEPPKPPYYKLDDSLKGMKRIYWGVRIALLLIAGLGILSYFTDGGKRRAALEVHQYGCELIDNGTAASMLRKLLAGC